MAYWCNYPVERVVGVDSLGGHPPEGGQQEVVQQNGQGAAAVTGTSGVQAKQDQTLEREMVQKGTYSGIVMEMPRQPTTSCEILSFLSGMITE